MRSQQPSSQRHIYLLRCWQEPRGDGAPPMWRFRLEDPRTGERHGFSTLEAMMKFLQETVVDDAPAGARGA